MTEYTESLNESLHILLEPPMVFYAIGGVVAFVVILVLISRYRRSHRGIVPFKSNGGQVEIAPATVKMLIVHVVGDVSGVEWVGCRLRHGRKLVVYLSLHVRATTPLREIETETKRKVRNALNHQFGLDNVDAIHIRVTKVIGAPPPIEEEAALPPAQPPPPAPLPEPTHIREREPMEDPFSAPVATEEPAEEPKSFDEREDSPPTRPT